MNLITLQRKLNTDAKCIAHLEKVRWGKNPICPYCNKDERITERQNTYRYHCNKCNRDFSVLVGTIYEGTKLDLPTWFYLTALMVNAPMGISHMELSRDLGIPYNTTWYACMRIRCGMLDQADLLEGIVEMDEAYLGGKPRKIIPPDNAPVLSRVENKRGRGTRKVPVVGAVSRGKDGQVTTKLMERLTTRNLLAMLKRYVNEDEAIVITDEFHSYKKFDEVVEHLTINHKEAFAKGILHTNTIEGFWSIIKNGIKGNYRAISKKYLPFYLAEYAFKYNRRNRRQDSFKEFIDKSVAEDKCLVNYKPKKNVKTLAYRRKRKKK
ncbi:MAG: IS1595 family transposase [Bacteroidetes bacterium]|nr:MAG: IS1595 family transposase [Bacteroidota bacterium]